MHIIPVLPANSPSLGVYYHATFHVLASMNVDIEQPPARERHAFFRNLVRKIPIGSKARGHIVAVIGEFFGTFCFLFFAFTGTQTANVASNTNTGTTVITQTVQKNPAQLLYISLAFGFSLAVNAWVYFRISGGKLWWASSEGRERDVDHTSGLFNPAVTLGMVLIGNITIIRGILLFIAQMLGAIVSAYVVQALFTGKLNVSTTLSTTTSDAQGVIIEMLRTAQLVFTIFMLAAEKHTGNFIAPVGIGLSLFIAELTGMFFEKLFTMFMSTDISKGVFWTGGSLNPARSFAPAVAIASFEKTQWVYWVGPLAGSVLAVILFKVIKMLEYETANPDPEMLAHALAEGNGASRTSAPSSSPPSDEAHKMA